MIIERVEAEGLFSFGTGANRFVLDLGEGLNVIVGPNASGKTNVLRVIELVQTAVLYQDPKRQDRSDLRGTLDHYVRFARHDRMPSSSSSEVRLVLAFTGGDRTIITSFIRAVVLAGLLDQQNTDEVTLSAIEGWVASEVTEEKLASLFRGTIVVSHSGVPGTEWRVAYEFKHDGKDLVWHLQTPLPNRSGVIEDKHDPPKGIPNAVPLVRRLHGGNYTPRQSPPQPPLCSFAINTLLPSGDEVVHVVANPISVTHLPAPLRDFAEIAQRALPSDSLTPQKSELNLASAFSVVFAAGLRHPGRDELGSVSSNDSISSVAEHLFRLKNGMWLAQAIYRDIQQMFSALVPGRRFDLRIDEPSRGSDETAPVIQIEVFPDNGAIIPDAVRPLRLAGKGVEQALLLANALVVSSDQTLILDEPATNLHPPWQRIVRSRLIASPGQRLLVTHSPYLVPAEDGSQLATIIRLSAPRGTTHVHRVFSDLEDPTWIDTITKELAWSADARGLLFANGVVLVEGGTELGSLPIWFAKSSTTRRHGSPEDLHIAFYSVGGDQSFGTFIRYLDRFSVPWAIICDGAAFRFDKGRHIFHQVIDSGVVDPQLQAFIDTTAIKSKRQPEMTAELFGEMVEEGARSGIFTLASGWRMRQRSKSCNSTTEGGSAEEDDESFEAFVLSQPDLTNPFEEARRLAPKSKPRVGRLLAEATDCPSPVEELYERILSRFFRIWAY